MPDTTDPDDASGAADRCRAPTLEEGPDVLEILVILTAQIGPGASILEMRPA